MFSMKFALILLAFGLLTTADELDDQDHLSLRNSFAARSRRSSCRHPNHCLSKWGFCGMGPEYCGAGCRAGPCTGSGSTSRSGNRGSGQACHHGNHCLSKWGFCGTGPEYCGDGCRAGPCTGTGGSSPDGNFQGDATYYIVSVGYTACGTRHGDGELIAALNAPQFDPYTPYGNPNRNSLCNKRAVVNGARGSAVVQIVDRCPECKYGDLDLSEAAFKAVVGDLGVGRQRISWRWA